MILGIISIIIGCIWYIRALWADNVNFAPQQTVQYLGFVCGSIFIVGGMILCQLGYKNMFKNTETEKKWMPIILISFIVFLFIGMIFLIRHFRLI